MFHCHQQPALHTNGGTEHQQHCQQGLARFHHYLLYVKLQQADKQSTLNSSMQHSICVTAYMVTLAWQGFSANRTQTLTLLSESDGHVVEQANDGHV